MITKEQKSLQNASFLGLIPLALGVLATISIQTVYLLTLILFALGTALSITEIVLISLKNKIDQKFLQGMTSCKQWLGLLATSSLVLCLVGRMNSPTAYYWLCAFIGAYLVSSKNRKTLLDLISQNLGPTLLLFYCLWLTIANAVNAQSTNEQIPYYLSLIFLGVSLACMCHSDKTGKRTKILGYSVAVAVILSTLQRLLFSNFYDFLPIINYKNYAAIAGLFALPMLESFEKNRTNKILVATLYISLLVNPSVLGQLGLVIWWMLKLWLLFPTWIQSKSQSQSQSQTESQYYSCFPIPNKMIEKISAWGNGLCSKTRKKINIFHKLMPLLGVATILALLLPYYDNLSNMLSKNDNLNGRMDVWQTALVWIKEKPLFGNGPCFWEERGSVAVHNKGNQGHRPEGFNGLLDPSVQSGIPAAILLLLGLVLSLKNTNCSKEEKYLLLMSLLLGCSTETHSLLGVRPSVGEAILVTWLAFVWSKTKIANPQNQELQ